MSRRKRLLVLVGLAAVTLMAVLASLYRPPIDRGEIRRLYAVDGSRFAEVCPDASPGNGEEPKPFPCTEVHYRDEGPGDEATGSALTLVLLHGTASSLHTWNRWADDLRRKHRVVRFDLQGYGLTGPNADRVYTVDRQVAVGEALLRHLGVGKAVLGGNSLGGQVAWRWAVAHPERARGLILVDAAGAPREEASGDDAGGGTVLDLATIPGLRHLLTRLTPRFLVESGLEDVYGDPSRLEPAVVDRHYRMLLAEGNRKALVDAMTSRRAPQSSARLEPKQAAHALRRLHVPALVLWGAEDDWIPPSHGERFHELLPSSELVVYDDLGHVPQEEAPERTVEDVRVFLASLAAAP